MLRTTKRDDVCCDRCGTVLRTLEEGEEYVQPPVLLSLFGEVVGEPLEIREACTVCRKAVVDPVRRLKRLPAAKKAEAAGQGEE